jgi:hypothetical protein
MDHSSMEVLACCEAEERNKTRRRDFLFENPGVVFYWLSESDIS